MNLFIIFVLLSIVNVILNTFKTTITVKGGKLAAALINAVTFFVYTYVIIYTSCDLPMFLKASVTAIINFVGVYAVKWFEEKARKDKLWLVKITIPHNKFEVAKQELENNNISFSYNDIIKYVVFDTYCYTQKETAFVETLCKSCNGKMFATENKLAL